MFSAHFLLGCYNCAAEQVMPITPPPLRNSSRQVTPIVYLIAPLYVALLVRLCRV